MSPAMDAHAPSRWRMAWLMLGWGLIVASPIVGIIPGPGGVFVFTAGAAILMRHSCWAKRRYVVIKRRWPKLGRAADRMMGRTPRGAVSAPLPID